MSLNQWKGWTRDTNSPKAREDPCFSLVEMTVHLACYINSTSMFYICSSRLAPTESRQQRAATNQRREEKRGRKRNWSIFLKRLYVCGNLYMHVVYVRRKGEGGGRNTGVFDACGRKTILFYFWQLQQFEYVCVCVSRVGQVEEDSCNVAWRAGMIVWIVILEER